MRRDSFGSRFGALVAMAGSAVGLGNLWRFPYLVGENGGAAFIIIYILMSFLICLPIFICEFVVGRRSQENAYSAFRDLSGDSWWKYVGVMTVIVPLIVTSYYSVVGGWSVEYLFKSLILWQVILLLCIFAIWSLILRPLFQRVLTKSITRGSTVPYWLVQVWSGMVL